MNSTPNGYPRPLGGALLVLALGILCLPAGLLAQAPRGVSPGSATMSKQLGTSCPTFSWGGIAGAAGYELVVYRVAENGTLKQFQRLEIPAGATSWTPAAAECPASGGRYAWAVRAQGGKSSGTWSEALLFETAGRPSEDEVRQALQVLHRYRESDRQVSVTTDKPSAPVAKMPEGAGVPEVQRLGQRESPDQTPPRERIGGAKALTIDTVGSAPSPRTVMAPTNLTLDIDGDFDLAGFVFQAGVPLLHTDGGATYKNTALGLNALVSSTLGLYSGIYNSAFGYAALESNTTGYSNTATGSRAMNKNTTGRFNTATGVWALLENISGRGNAASGYWALRKNTTGQHNTADGYLALRNNTTGTLNTATGALSLENNLDSSYNTATGASALQANTGFSNTATGNRALRSNTTGGLNTAMGVLAFYNNDTGAYGTAIGFRALHDNIVGDQNTAVGSEALFHNTGSHNTAVGRFAGSGWTTGSYNIALGYGSSGTKGETATIRIGGYDNQSKTFIEGIRGATVAPAFGANPFDQAVCISTANQLGPCNGSSARFKEAIEAMGDTASRVSALRPVTFRYIPKEGQPSEQPLQYGLIAEEVAELFPTLVSYDDDGKPYTVRYSLLTPLLLNELQRQEEAFSTRMEAQEAETEKLRQVVADQQRRLEKLAKKKRFRSD